MKSEKPECQLIGAGRAGKAISIAMSEAGYRFTWIGSHRLGDASALAVRTGTSGYGVKFDGFQGKAGFLILAVPDDTIADASSDAVKAGCIGQTTVVAHLSGALGSDTLDSARREGAAVMAFHPAQSITADSDPRNVFKSICFDMEGDDDACNLGKRVAEDLGAESVRLNPEARILSHLAMTVASNYTVSLMRMAEEIMSAAGIPEDTARKMLIPLFSTTAGNISSEGTLNALTGPVSRGDSEIIQKHISALQKLRDDYRKLYSGLADIAVKLSIERGDISEMKAEEIRKLLGG